MAKEAAPGHTFFGRYLKGVLDKYTQKGQSLADLAKRAGLHASLWSKYVHGDRTPDPQTIEAIGQGLGLDDAAIADMKLMADLDRTPASVRFLIDSGLHQIEEFVRYVRNRYEETDAGEPVTGPSGIVSLDDPEAPDDAVFPSEPAPRFRYSVRFGAAVVQRTLADLRTWFPADEPPFKEWIHLQGATQRAQVVASITPENALNRQDKLITQLAAVSGVPDGQVNAYVQGMKTFLAASKSRKHGSM